MSTFPMIYIIMKGSHKTPKAIFKAKSIEETLYWLRDFAKDIDTSRYAVWDTMDNTYQDIEDFLAGSTKVTKAEGTDSEMKMRKEDLHDPEVHARNHTILQFVQRAMRAATNKEPDYEDMDLIAKGTTYEIINLFEIYQERKAQRGS